MKNEQLIPVHDFCTYHKIEISFINSLNEYGLIEITTIEETNYIYAEQLKELEKMIRLHYDLDINIEGIDAISHLLKKLDSLNEELMELRNKLGSREIE